MAIVVLDLSSMRCRAETTSHYHYRCSKSNARLPLDNVDLCFQYIAEIENVAQIKDIKEICSNTTELSIVDVIHVCFFYKNFFTFLPVQWHVASRLPYI